MEEARRRFLRVSLFSALAAFAGSGVAGCGSRSNDAGLGSPLPAQGFGPLQDPDPNGVRLPIGFEARIVARSGEAPFPGSGFTWHDAPDGGATFATQDGGWIYVSNSEIDNLGGGAGALRFDAAGRLTDAYPILSGTTLNCAGGRTPWGTWLSCEEFAAGHVWECDPLGGFGAVRLPALGAFRHEAAAVDPVTGLVYLSEDRPDGRFYRFVPERATPGGLPDLSSGSLQVAEVVDGVEGPVRWHEVSDPAGVMIPTRNQVAESTSFNRGEGLWFDAGFVYMATTGDNRIWAFDARNQALSILYDDDLFPDPVLRGVDNLTVSPGGDIFVAEDGDDMQLIALTPNGELEPVLQIVGHDESEIAGPAFDPSGTRLYFSSQRGATGLDQDGVTFEIRGPFIR